MGGLLCCCRVYPPDTTGSGGEDAGSEGEEAGSGEEEAGSGGAPAPLTSLTCADDVLLEHLSHVPRRSAACLADRAVRSAAEGRVADAWEACFSFSHVCDSASRRGCLVQAPMGVWWIVLPTVNRVSRSPGGRARCHQGRSRGHPCAAARQAGHARRPTNHARRACKCLPIVMTKANYTPCSLPTLSTATRCFASAATSFWSIC